MCVSQLDLFYCLHAVRGEQGSGENWHHHGESRSNEFLSLAVVLVYVRWTHGKGGVQNCQYIKLPSNLIPLPCVNAHSYLSHIKVMIAQNPV